MDVNQGALNLPEGGAGQGADSGTGAGENLWGFLPEGLASLQGEYKAPTEFWAQTSALHSLAKEKEAVTGTVPDSLASEEEWQAFWAKAGKPAKAEEYKVPDTFTGEAAPEVVQKVNEYLAKDRTELMQIAHACNMTNKQAEAFFGQVGNVLAKSIGEVPAAADPAQVMQELWPSDPAAGLDIARRGAAFAGIGTDLDKAGLSTSPLVLKLSHALGKLIGEDGKRGGEGNASLPSGSEAKAELQKVVGSAAYQSNDPVAIKRAEALAARI